MTNMIEKEQRFRISDHEEKNLLKRFTGWSEPSAVVDITFGLSGPSSMITNGWVIRLRQKNGERSMEYKAVLNRESTLWEELSVAIGNIKETAKILQKIGLKAGLVLDRVRRECIYRNCKITLDDFPLLGKFVEVELLDNRSDFLPVFEMLGITEREKEKPYGDILLEMLETHPEKHKIIDDYLAQKL